jgi:hypothetical protein
MMWGWFIPPIEGALGDGLWHWAYHISNYGNGNPSFIDDVSIKTA